MLDNTATQAAEADTDLAPRRTDTTPTGKRKLTPEATAWRAKADAYEGLPDDISHNQIDKLIHAAAPAIGFSPEDVHFLHYLFRRTRAPDWRAGSRPIVWGSNARITRDLMIGTRALQARTASLVKRGWLVMKDTPDGQRHGKRQGPNGPVVAAETFGYDISVLAIRRTELKEAAKAHKRMQDDFQAARRRAFSAKHFIMQDIETAHEHGLWSAFWESTEQEAAPLFKRLTAKDATLEATTEIADRLGEMAAATQQQLNPINQTTKQEEDSPLGESNCTLNRSSPSSKLSTEATAGGLESATAMVDAFESVGTDVFDITHTNIQQEKRGFRPAQTLHQLRESLPYLVPNAAKRQNNLILRPRITPPRGFSFSPVTLIQLDDLEPINLAEIASAAFLTVQTSATGFQAWLAVSDAPKGFAARLKRGLLADQNASGAVRIAGTHNFKANYAPDFPIVKIVKAQHGHVVPAASLQHLLAPEKKYTSPPSGASPVIRSTTSKWPSYERCLENAPIGPSGNPMRSKADFVWSKIALSWGHSIEAVAAKLLEQSSKARENGQGYAMKTAENAAYAATQRNLALQGGRSR